MRTRGLQSGLFTRTAVAWKGCFSPDGERKRKCDIGRYRTKIEGDRILEECRNFRFKTKPCSIDEFYPPAFEYGGSANNSGAETSTYLIALLGFYENDAARCEI
jgi:hypothetical protein